MIAGRCFMAYTYILHKLFYSHFVKRSTWHYDLSAKRRKLCLFSTSLRQILDLLGRLTRVNWNVNTFPNLSFFCFNEQSNGNIAFHSFLKQLSVISRTYSISQDLWKQCIKLQPLQRKSSGNRWEEKKPLAMHSLPKILFLTVPCQRLTFHCATVSITPKLVKILHRSFTLHVVPLVRNRELKI